MMRIINLYVIGLSCVLFFSCGDNSGTPEVEVHWEHVSNFTNIDGVFESKLTLSHKGGKSLTNKNWALFFSLTPRTITEPLIPQKASVVHINGDWYKLVPGENFSLKSGEEMTIYYRGHGAIIKESDRPDGFYFVYYDEAGGEEEIVAVMNYKWEPFTDPSQIMRNNKDFEPIPTPAFQYSLNSYLSKLTESELQTIIPTPVSMNPGIGSFELKSGAGIRYSEPLQNEATYLQQKMQDEVGIDLMVNGEDPQITLGIKPMTINGISSEAYQLTINSRGIEILGSDPAGVLFGIQSLRALIPIDAFQNKNKSFQLPFVEISDAPRFPYRGLQLDVGRNFQSKESVLKLLDMMSFYKLNQFLFYFTEDEGWRVEIQSLPELTEVGAQRQHTSSYKDNALQPAYGSGPFAGQDGKYGHGFYTKADFIEILQYAKQRHIDVMPIINFPGHARAAVKAMEYRYDRLMNDGKETEANEFRLIDPDDQSEYLSAQLYKDNVVCVVKEQVYHFYETVFDDIEEMYKEAGVPLTKFHMGGDEVPNGAWTGSPLVASFLKEHPEIQGVGELRTYFVRTLLERLKDRNVEWHGWEEIALQKDANGEYYPVEEFAGKNVVPQIWNNLFDYPDIGYRLANAGYPVVLCNVSNFYFDMPYDKDPKEPGLYWGGFVNARDPWTFAPYNMYRTTQHTPLGNIIQVLGTEKRDNREVDIAIIRPGTEPPFELERLKPEAYKNILGIQAELWSETVKGQEMLEYCYLPKITGFSESAWAAERAWETVDDMLPMVEMQQKEWNVFANKLAIRELPRFSYLNGGYNYRVPPPGLLFEDNLLHANCEYPGLEIRYTSDGTDPDITSNLYTDPIPFKVGDLLRFRCFDKAGKGSRVILSE